jgi:uncharacterized protein YdhG (YjbR/CyaY superfamily)
LFPKEIQILLRQLHTLIRKVAPQAKEAISYGIPTYKLHGNLVHFAAYENHIGFYPGASGIAAFKKEIARYKSSKGTVQFPIDEPIPTRLVHDIVKFRVEENEEKAAWKKKKKTASKKTIR